MYQLHALKSCTFSVPKYIHTTVQVQHNHNAKKSNTDMFRLCNLRTSQFSTTTRWLTQVYELSINSIKATNESQGEIGLYLLMYYSASYIYIYIQSVSQKELQLLVNYIFKKIIQKIMFYAYSTFIFKNIYTFSTIIFYGRLIDCYLS